MKKRLIVLLVFGLAVHVRAQSPGSAGVPFLLIQPSVRAYGMGGTSVISSEHDPLSIAFNPAHAGMIAAEHYFSLEFYPSKTPWLTQLASDLEYDAKALFMGYDFKRSGESIALRVGASYTRVFIDLGEQIITGEDSPDPIGSFHSTESANLWSIGASIDYFIKVGIGWSFKDINSNLAPLFNNTTTRSDNSGQAHAHDFGVMAFVPLFEVVPQLKTIAWGNDSGFRPFLTPGLGYSQSNIGGKISYIDATQADPLPRMARAGASLNAGLTFIQDESPLQIFCL